MNVAPETAKPDEKVSLTVTVNGREVLFHVRRPTGAEIKATAISQGVVIQQDFALFEVKGPSHLKPVTDDDVIELHNKQAFRAVAPDDNS
jgi:hypothetical protein